MALTEQIIQSFSHLRGRPWYPVRIGNQSYRGDLHHIVFWKKVNRGLWEPFTYKILGELLTPDAVYCDIGAWIGPTVLPAASVCDKVFCFEPDRTAFRYLLQNLQLNRLKNVVPFNIALAAEDSISSLASPRGKQGDSMSSLLFPGGKNAQEALCLSWETWLNLAGRPKIDFLKIDIEGGEYALMASMATYLNTEKPQLYISLHPHLLAEEARYAKMSDLVEILDSYHHYTDISGREHPITSLLEEQSLNLAGSYLLLP